MAWALRDWQLLFPVSWNPCFWSPDLSHKKADYSAGENVWRGPGTTWRGKGSQLSPVFKP